MACKVNEFVKLFMHPGSKTGATNGSARWQPTWRPAAWWPSPDWTCCRAAALPPLQSCLLLLVAHRSRPPTVSLCVQPRFSAPEPMVRIVDRPIWSPSRSVDWTTNLRQLCWLQQLPPPLLHLTRCTTATRRRRSLAPTRSTERRPPPPQRWGMAPGTRQCLLHDNIFNRACLFQCFFRISWM